MNFNFHRDMTHAGNQNSALQLRHTDSESDSHMRVREENRQPRESPSCDAMVRWPAGAQFRLHKRTHRLHKYNLALAVMLNFTRARAFRPRCFRPPAC